MRRQGSSESEEPHLHVAFIDEDPPLIHCVVILTKSFLIRTWWSLVHRTTGNPSLSKALPEMVAIFKHRKALGHRSVALARQYVQELAMVWRDAFHRRDFGVKWKQVKRAKSEPQQISSW